MESQHYQSTLAIFGEAGLLSFFRRDRRHIAALRAVLKWLDENRIEHVLIGGFAVGVLARPRFTQDIDFLVRITQHDWEIAAKQARGFGLRVLSDDPEAPTHEARIMHMRHESGGDIDLIVVGTEFEREIIKRGAVLEIQSMRCNVISPDDLIILKLIAGRAQDLADCHIVVETCAGIDWDRIEHMIARWTETTKKNAPMIQLGELKRKAGR